MTGKSHVIMLMLGIALGVPTAAHTDEVPYETTPPAVVDAMLSIAGVGEKDYLFDLGSGDGRIVIAAAKRFHARGVGIEYDGTLVALSREIAEREGVSDRVEFLQQDIFASDFRNATVLTMYLLPEVNLDLRPTDPVRNAAGHSRRVARLGYGGLGTRRPTGDPDDRKVGVALDGEQGVSMDRAGSRRGVLARHACGSGWRGTGGDRVRATLSERVGKRVASPLDHGG